MSSFFNHSRTAIRPRQAIETAIEIPLGTIMTGRQRGEISTAVLGRVQVLGAFGDLDTPSARHPGGRYRRRPVCVRINEKERHHEGQTITLPRPSRNLRGLPTGGQRP